MFENKGNMLSHIVENHEREKMGKFNNKGDLTLSCDENEVRTDAQWTRIGLFGKKPL